MCIIKTVTLHKIPNDSQILNLAYFTCETFMYVKILGRNKLKKNNVNTSKDKLSNIQAKSLLVKKNYYEIFLLATKKVLMKTFS